MASMEALNDGDRMYVPYMKFFLNMHKNLLKQVTHLKLEIKLKLAKIRKHLKRHIGLMKYLL